jgi:hypothetical protein
MIIRDGTRILLPSVCGVSYHDSYSKSTEITKSFDLTLAGSIHDPVEPILIFPKNCGKPKHVFVECACRVAPGLVRIFVGTVALAGLAVAGWGEAP